jgi:hypothetical protein
MIKNTLDLTAMLKEAIRETELEGVPDLEDYEIMEEISQWSFIREITGSSDEAMLRIVRKVIAA